MHKEIITKYQRGKDYTLWYYFRYFPSINRLKEKLKEKTNSNHELIELIFNDVIHLFNDLDVLDSKVQNLLFRNKNKNYIISNLLQKKFNKEDIITILNKYIKSWESILTQSFLERKIKQLKWKNKSKNYIKNKLIEQQEDKEIVEQVLNNIFWIEWDIEWLIFEYGKLFNKNIEQKKIIQRLLVKWFNYSDIKKVLK